MASFSSTATSLLLLEAVNATLEDPSFRTRSEVAAHARKATETLKDWCEDKDNEEPYTEFYNSYWGNWKEFCQQMLHLKAMRHRVQLRSGPTWSTEAESRKVLKPVWLKVMAS